ncbi:hypothetical protein KKF86_04905 [bacterium]|nr:hypothetical protein [bacterium]
MVEKKIQEDLAVIKQIMLESRQRFYNVGIHLVVWGGIVILALLLTYYSLSIKFLLPEYWIWIVGFGLAWIFEFWQQKRHQNSERVYNTLNRMSGTLWTSILITMMIYIVFGGVGGHLIEGTSAIIAGLLAIGYLVTSVGIGIKWIKILGLGWWLGSIILFFSPSEIGLLIMAVLMIFLQFIPGVILFVKGPKND